jgi:RNA polymerase sigma-70 factor, ECF subfamily
MGDLLRLPAMLKGGCPADTLGSYMPAEQLTDTLEAKVRALCEAGDLRAASNMALRGYGPEVLGFLGAVLGDPTEAEEVFSLFCEDLWKGLARFEWRSSLRTWAYTLARNAWVRYRQRVALRNPRHEPLDSEVMNLAAEVRQSTASYMKGERQEQIHRLRSTLSAEEQMLLTLRIDRRMEWPDIAQVLEPEASEPHRAASRLRKRFQRLKERMRAALTAEAQGGRGHE